MERYYLQIILCSVSSDKGSTILYGKLNQSNVYELDVRKLGSTVQAQSMTTCKAVKSEHIQVWHRRLGYLNPVYMRQLRDHAATGINFTDEMQSNSCEACIFGKYTKKPFYANPKRASQKLELVHSDLCQVSEPSNGQAKYFLTFLDDHTRKIFVYFLKTKDMVLQSFKHFITYMENQCETKIKTLRTDNGKEYMNEKLKNVIDAAGIHHETSIAYNPQQNGRAERINRTLLDKARCMLAESKLPKSFWAEAIATAAFLSNRSPKESFNGATPEECWTGEKPDLSFLKVFGNKAYAYVPSQFRSKLEPKTRPCIMVGYCQNQKGYRLWNPQQKKVITARDAIFQELENEKNPRDCIYLPISEPMDTNQPLNSDVAPTQGEDDAHATE